MISLSGVTKSFGQHRALAGVDIHVDAGQVLGLLGPNGAGKTTTVRVITTLLHPDEGEVYVAGYSARTQPHQVRANLGASGQYAAVDDKLTGFENLTMVGELYGLRRRDAKARARDLLAQFRLDDVPDSQRAGTYSGGMKRRLDLAGAIVARPPVVILDEPTTGLDPRGRRDTWDAVTALTDGGTTVLLTTQYLEEADALADTVAVIDAGRIIAQGTAAALKADAGGAWIDVILSHSDQADLAVHALRRAAPNATLDPRALRLTAPAPQGTKTLREVLSALDASGVSLAEAALRHPTLDEVFLQLTADHSSHGASSAVGDSGDDVSETKQEVKL